MKTITILSVIFLFMVNLSFANDGKYVEAMQKNMQIVYTSDSIPQIQGAVNAFERIAAAEKTKWEPYYYASFGYIMMSNKEKDPQKKDTYLDQATTALDKARALVPKESEVAALEGFIHMMRLTVDPASRGQRYSRLSGEAFGKALALNPENPRALALQAQMQFGTAQFFGSSTDQACASAKASVEKFNTFKSDNPLAPQWGKQMAEKLAGQCK